MGLILPGIQTRQPQQGLRINWANPLTRGLISAIDGRSGRDLLAGAPTTITTAQEAGGQGVGARYAAGTYQTYSFLNRNKITNQLSYFTLTDYEPSGAPNSFMFGDTQATGVGYNAGLYSNTGLFSFFVKTGGTGTQITSTTSAATAMKRLRHAASYDGATMALYINGVLEKTGAKTGNVDAGAFSLNINRWNTASSHGGLFYFGLVWNRALSEAENASLAANPWQIFDAPQHLLLVEEPSGGAATYSYTASGGFALSGTASVLRGAVKTASGGVTLSGTASMAKGKAITASGGLSLSGAATILRGVARSAAGGLQLAGAAGVTFFSAVQSRVVNPVGGIIFGGTAAVVRTCTRLVSGGITFGGTSPVEFFSILSTGASDWIGYIRRRGRR